jgi:transposase
MSKTTNKFSAEVRERAVRLVLDNEAQHPSRWQAVMSIAAKIGCTPQTLNDWVKKAEVDSGRRGGIPTEMAEKMKAIERENRELDTRINPVFWARIAHSGPYGRQATSFCARIDAIRGDIHPFGRTHPLAWPRSWKIRRSML